MYNKSMNGNVLKGGIFMNPTKEFRDYMISQGAALRNYGASGFIEVAQK